MGWGFLAVASVLPCEWTDSPRTWPGKAPDAEPFIGDRDPNALPPFIIAGEEGFGEPCMPVDQIEC